MIVLQTYRFFNSSGYRLMRGAKLFKCSWYRSSGKGDTTTGYRIIKKENAGFFLRRVLDQSKFAGGRSAACWTGSTTAKYHASAITVPAIASPIMKITRFFIASDCCASLIRTTQSYERYRWAGKLFHYNERKTVVIPGAFLSGKCYKEPCRAASWTGQKKAVRLQGFADNSSGQTTRVMVRFFTCKNW